MGKEKGITIISLVITIIVLIILAGTSISMLFGENGIITVAKRAKQNIEQAQLNEQISLNELYEQMENGIVPSEDVQYGTVTYHIDNDNVQTQKFLYEESILNPSFSSTKEDYLFVGWREDNTASSEVLTEKTIATENVDLYAVFKQTITLSYDANGGSTTPENQTADKYYNNGNTQDATFTLATAISRTDYNFKNWKLNSTSGTEYDAGTNITLTENATMYANWEIKTGTVTYYINTGSTQTQTFFYGSSILSPSFSPSISGWTFVGWREDKTASSTVLTSKTISSDSATLYAVFKQDITVTYYNNSTSASTSKKQKYYNNGNVSNPSFALSQAAKSGWTARGWSTSTAGNGGITYNNGATFSRDSNVTLYGMYQQTITLSYSGNGNTGGSTSAQTGTRYYNSGKNVYVNPSFSLRSNGFTKTNYSFSKWAMGSTSGTQYAAGASVTLSSNTTFYAIWTYAGSPVKVVSPELTNANSGYSGSVFKVSTVTYDPQLFSYTSGSDKIYCKVAGNYKFTVVTRATVDAESWHVSIYINNVNQFNAGFTNSYSNVTTTKTISLKAGDYIECKSGASIYTNGYATLTITK